MGATKAQKKLQAWVEKNPDGYMEKNYFEIGREAGASGDTARMYLHHMVAEHNGIDSGVVRQKYDAVIKARMSMTVPERLQAWVERNPDGYLKLTSKQISQESSVSEASVNEHFSKIIAERDDILPSEGTPNHRQAMKDPKLMLSSKKTVREKLQAWVEKNPDGYLKLTFKQISIEADVSEGSVNGHLAKIIAERDGILPSEVTARRVAAGFRQSPLELPPEKVDEIRKLHNQDKLSIPDISHITKCCEITVRKYIR